MKKSWFWTLLIALGSAAAFALWKLLHGHETAEEADRTALHTVGWKPHDSVKALNRDVEETAARIKADLERQKAAEIQAAFKSRFGRS